MTIDLRRSKGGDWIALYVNGKRMIDGHSLTPTVIINALGFEVNSDKTYADPDEEVVFPENLRYEPKTL